jgi:Na+/proline symporter
MNSIPVWFHETGSFLFSARNEIEQLRGERSTLGWSLSGVLIVVFVLLFSYEVLVTSQVLAGLIFGESGQVPHQAFIAGAIFVSTMVYTIRTGVRGVFATDTLQFGGIMAFILLLIVCTALVWSPAADSPVKPAADWLKLDHQTWINVFLASLTAITTQLYNLLNHYSVSNLQQRQSRRKVLGTGSLILASIPAVLVLVGALTDLDMSKGVGFALANLTEPLTGISFVGPLVTALMLFGLTGVLISTVDTLLVALANVFYESLLRQSPYNVQSSPDALHRLRKLILWIFACAFGFMAFMFYASPPLFYLLLGIASGGEVCAPLIVLIAVLARAERGLAILSNGILVAFLALSVSVLSINLWASKTDPQIVPYVSLVHLLLSCALATIVYSAARKRRSK